MFINLINFISQSQCLLKYNLSLIMEGKKGRSKSNSPAQLQQFSNNQLTQKYDDALQLQRRLDIRAFSRPVVQQADILEYFHYWRERIPDILQIYQCLSADQKYEVKRRLYICHRYGKLYLPIFLSIWYSYLILCIEKEFSSQSSIIIPQEELEGIIAKIYETHKEPVQPLDRFPQEPKPQKSEPKKSKALVSLIVTNIVAFFFKKDQGYIDPEEEKMVKKK